MGLTAAHDERPALSIIVPVYNGEAFIADTVRQLSAYLGGISRVAELIVVDDGSTDQTPVLLRDAAAASRVPTRVLRSDRNEGKGAAIRKGMQVARGEHRVFLDADLAYPLSDIGPVDVALSRGADVAIACRVHQRSRVLINPAILRYFFIRHAAGRFFNWIVRVVLLPGVLDSQAGLKGFSAAAADRLFAGWLPRGFNFDLALLFRARRLGLRIEQVPVFYRYEIEPSTVRLVRDTGRAIRDLVQIRLRLVSDRFEQWNSVIRVRSGAIGNRVRSALRSPEAQNVLAVGLGVSIIALVIVRLAMDGGWTAAVAWAGSLLAVCLMAWRSDLLRASRPTRWFRGKAEGAGFAAVILAGAAIRMLWLGDVPPMIHGDSAECGLLGLAILRHQVPDVFNFSSWYQTPYLSFVPYAASFSLTGLSMFGLRLPSAVLGVATMVPLYFLVRTWFGVRQALFVTALFAVSHGAIHFSRIGLWNIQVLFYEVTAFALLAAGLRRARALWQALAGIVSGLALYSYTGGRLIPVIAGTFLAVQVMRKRRRALRGMLYYAAGLLLAAGPLVVNYVKNPSAIELDRTASVWVLAEENRPHLEASLGTSSPPAVLWEQTKLTLAGFVTLGDRSTQYGTDQPLLSPFGALLAVAGVWVAFRNRRESRYLFLLLWLGFGLVLGSILVLDPPSYTRLIVLFPVPYILIAGAVGALIDVGRRLMPLRRSATAVIYLLLVAQAAAFNLVGYYKFSQRMATMPREWDVLEVIAKLGDRYDYYLYTGPFLLADSPIFRLFSANTRAVSGFSETDLPTRLGRDAAFVLTPEFRRFGVAISKRFPGVEREVLDTKGVRQMVIYRCTAENGCRRGRTP